MKLLQLHIARHEARQATFGGHLESRSRLAGARHLIDLHRIGEALYRHGAEGLHGDVAFRQLESIGRRKHGTRLCHLFQTSGQVRRLAHDGVFHVQIVADAADDDLPRVESDPDHHSHPLSALKLFRVLLDGFLHPERRITCAYGVILVGDRCTKERHDAVANDSVHGALVMMDRLDHAFEHRVEDLLRSLGVAISKQLHRTLDVGKQDGDLFALSLEGCPCGADLIGEV